jgi:hypothetical protein
VDLDAIELVFEAGIAGVGRQAAWAAGRIGRMPAGEPSSRRRKQRVDRTWILDAEDRATLRE